MSEIKRPLNKLLASVPAGSFGELSSKLELVPLNFGENLHRAGESIRDMYFPESGVVSLIQSTADSSYVEVGMVGNEGVAGFPVALGARSSPGTTVVQVGGSAYRLSTTDYSQMDGAIAPLRVATLRFINGLMAQTSLAAACIAFHPANKRLARWLLMTHDRIDADEFPTTQEFLAQMLGVRREAVNRYVGELRDEGLIDYTRGKITVKDRSGLEKTSCACYIEIAGAYGSPLG